MSNIRQRTFDDKNDIDNLYKAVDLESEERQALSETVSDLTESLVWKHLGVYDKDVSFTVPNCKEIYIVASKESSFSSWETVSVYTIMEFLSSPSNNFISCVGRDITFTVAYDKPSNTMFVEKNASTNANYIDVYYR